MIDLMCVLGHAIVSEKCFIPLYGSCLFGSGGVIAAAGLCCIAHDCLLYIDLHLYW